VNVNWTIVGTVAAIAFQTVALTATVITTAQATQDTVTEMRVDISYLKRDVQRLSDKVFP
jgi:hypothetical protein